MSLRPSDLLPTASCAGRSATRQNTGCTHERTAERTITIRSNEPASTLLLNITAIAGRRYLYRVVPNVAYVEPHEELVVKGIELDQGPAVGSPLTLYNVCFGPSSSHSW